MTIFGFQEESEISRHHEPHSQVVSHPEYCSTTIVLLSGFGISNYFGGCKEEVGWKTSHMVHPYVEGLNAVLYQVFSNSNVILSFNFWI
jgi:hypothetical protein